jgi:hypothetical protein
MISRGASPADAASSSASEVSGKLQDLFGCYRSHFDDTGRKALVQRGPYVTDGREMLLLNCSCEQMTTEIVDLSQAALR